MRGRDCSHGLPAYVLPFQHLLEQVSTLHPNGGVFQFLQFKVSVYSYTADAVPVVVDLGEDKVSFFVPIFQYQPSVHNRVIFIRLSTNICGP